MFLSLQIDRFRNAYTPEISDMTDIDAEQEELEDDHNSDDSSARRLEYQDDRTGALYKTERRQRRSIATAGDNGKMSTSGRMISEADTEFLSELNCGLTQCTFISCTIGPLAKKEFTLFKVKSRLWVRTLNEIQRTDIEISSKLVSRVTKLPYGVNPSYLGYKTHVVTTQVC